MTSADQVKDLLAKVGLITWKHQQILQGPEHRFNVFTILRRADDEVYLHSRFLAELLDPDGGHCHGHAFLEALLKRVGITDFVTDNVSVRCEYRDIDILVTNDNQAVVTENKIYAQDQSRQLERYHTAVCEEGFEDVFIVYLTLRGSAPSPYSLGALRDRLAPDTVYCISYQDDIHDWLDECIALTCRHPTVRETLVQYQKLVARLTGQSLSKEYIMEVKELLKDETNIELAVNISQALIEAKVDIQLAFWKELEAQLTEAGFQIAVGQPENDRHSKGKYSRKKIEHYYETDIAGRYYGLTIKLADVDEKTELVYYVKASRQINLGFAAIRHGTRKIAKEPQFDDIAALVKEVMPAADRTPRSIGLIRKPELAFESFDTPTVFALADPDKHEQIVSELAEEIASHIERFMILYEES